MLQPAILPANEKRAKRRRIAVALSAAFLFLAGLVSLAVYTTPPAGTSHPHHAAKGVAPWVGWMIVSGSAALIAALVAAAFYNLRSTRISGRERDAALSLLARGALTEAKARFEALSKRRLAVGFAIDAKYHLGVIMMRLGDIEGALERFVSLQRSSSLTGEARAVTCIQLGVCLLLSGDLAAGEAWLAEADARASETMSSRLLADHQLVFARALFDCRRGAQGEAARNLQSRWRELEASLTGEAIRPLRILHAFAIASSSGPRESAQVDQLLQPLRNGQAGEFAWLGARWPEMQAFLATYSL